MSAEDPSLDPYLRRLFAGPDDYDLIDGVYQRMAEQVELVSYGKRRNLASLSPEQRVVYDVWYAYSFLEEGGFSYLLQDDSDVTRTLAASFETIGDAEAAQAVRDSLALLPGGQVPSGFDEATVERRSELIESLSEADQRRLDELSEIFWSGDTRLVHLTADYIRRHKQTFASLPPTEYEDLAALENENLPVPAADAPDAEVAAWLTSIGAYPTRRGPYLATMTVPVTVPRAGNVIMHVSLPAYRRSTDEEVRHMAELKALQELRGLDLGSSRISREGLRHLSKFPHLQALSFHGAALQDDWLDEIVRLKGLREINLSGTAITDAGTRRLGELVELRSLRLSDTQITDAGVETLAALTQLEELELATQFGGVGLRALEGLPIRELDLSDSQVTDEGLAALAGLKKLESLDLTDCQFGPEALPEIGRCMSLQILSLDGTSVTDEGLRQLAGLTNLGELRLTGTPVQGHGFAELKGLKKLVTLQLYDAEITDDGVEAIAGLPAVETLTLGDTPITGRSLGALSTMKSLRHLNLSGTKTPGSVALRQLEKLPALESLSLPEELRENSHAKYLQEKLPNCDIYFY